MVIRPVPRILLFLAYLFMGISAVMSFFVPLASFSLVGWKVWIYVWAGSLTAGGLMGAISALLRSVGTELVAITLLMTGYAAYSIVLVSRVMYLIGHDHFTETPGSSFVLGTTLGLVLFLARRYIELWQLIRSPQPPGGTR